MCGIYLPPESLLCTHAVYGVKAGREGVVRGCCRSDRKMFLEIRAAG